MTDEAPKILYHHYDDALEPSAEVEGLEDVALINVRFSDESAWLDVIQKPKGTTTICLTCGTGDCLHVREVQKDVHGDHQ